MRAALLLARAGDGVCAPNPAVGCVIVKDDVLLGRGRTGAGGRPHAEIEAINSIKPKANIKGSTAYVTLEPCAHHGETPPCCDALIASGVVRVVVGMPDPDPKVNGKGIAQLKKAGIAVTTHVLGDAIRQQLIGYITHRTQTRPFCAAKVAVSLDGRIALANGKSQWLTGKRARHYVHDLRSRYDGVLTSSRTLIADNPRLTTRLPGMSSSHQPRRIVLGTHAPLTAKHALAQTATRHAPVMLITSSKSPTNALPKNKNITMHAIKSDRAGRPHIAHALTTLHQAGIMSVLVEAGGILLASLLQHDLLDRLYWLVAPKVIGGEGKPAIDALGESAPTDLGAMTGTSGWRCIETRRLGYDQLQVLDRVRG